MGNSSRKSSFPKGSSSAGRRVRWGGPGIPAPPGKPILIPCEGDSQPDTVEIRWERSLNNGGSAIMGYLVEHRKMGSPNWIRSTSVLCTYPELTLSGLEPGWRYQFRVRAQNGLGISEPSELSDPLTVSLQRAAASVPKFEIELKDTVVLENDQIEFLVSYSGSPLPKIAWFKDGFEIFSSRRTRIITENGRSTLVIHRIALDDEGEIKCTATNRAGHVSTKARLTLEAPPRVRLPRQYEDGLLFEQDETIRLKVSLAGRPAPEVTWIHNGEPIPRDERHVFDSMEGESSMKIPDAKRKDRGEYTIKAVNKLGEDMASFLVTVTDRPSAPGKASVSMTLGRSATLTWQEPEDDGGCKIGTYIVEYYRMGWDMWLKAASCRQTTTVLSELIEGSEYRFRVKAENPYGVSEPSEESDTIFIPDLKRGITSPSMRGKAQSHREIPRGRSEKREVSFIEPSQRTRSLTREEARIREGPGERTVSTQRLSSAPPKPPRVDSRVHFALDKEVNQFPRSFQHSGEHFEQTEQVEKELEPKKTTLKPTVITITTAPEESEPDPEPISFELASRAMSSSRESSPLTLAVVSTVRTQDSTHQLRSSAISRPILRKEVNSFDLSSDKKAAFAVERSKSADDASSVVPEGNVKDMMHGSSEFMLVLYPEHEVEGFQKTSDAEEKAGASDKDKRLSTIEDNDLVAPPMSFSLPELFSASHEVVEIIREAVSSTELLHERAMERFYRAVAAEEAANQNKRKTKIEEETELFERRASPLRRRLSNAGAQALSWKVTKERRKSGENQIDSRRTSLRLPSIGVLEDAVSDPNLISNKQESHQSNEDRFQKWRDSGTDLLSKSDDYPGFSDEILAEDSIPSSEMSSEESSNEDLRQLKARILAIPVVEEEETYHPRGRVIVEPEKPSSPTPIVPKSILKKRPDEPIPVDKFGRPIPPEVSLEKPEAQRHEPVTMRKRSLTSPPKSENQEPIVKLGADQETVLSAGEAAVNRRRQMSKQVSSKSIDSEVEEQLAEERMAVVSHYTEIVKEYSMAHSAFPPSSRPSSRQGFDETRRSKDVRSPKVDDSPTHKPLASSVRPSFTPDQSEPQRSRDVRSLSRGRSTFQEDSKTPSVPQKIVIPLEPSKIIPKKLEREVLSPPRGRTLLSPESRQQKMEFSRSDDESYHRRDTYRRSVTPSSKVSSRPQSRNESPILRSRNVSRDRESGVRHKKSSRPASRSSSKDRSRTVTPTEARMERLQKALEDKKFRSRRVSEGMAEASREMIIEAEANFRSTISYVIDVTLLLAAVYVYLFKKEIFAVPFIGLLLYRHVQQELKKWLSSWGQRK